MILYRLLFFTLLTILLNPDAYSSVPDADITKVKADTVYDRQYTLQASMLGYFDADGTRNPVLQAQKGERVRIKIVNGEPMTHDIALEQLGIKSSVLVEKGDTASIVFTAEASDIYFCTIPGHRAAGTGLFSFWQKTKTSLRLPCNVLQRWQQQILQRL